MPRLRTSAICVWSLFLTLAHLLLLSINNNHSCGWFLVSFVYTYDSDDSLEIKPSYISPLPSLLFNRRKCSRPLMIVSSVHIISPSLVTFFCSAPFGRKKMCLVAVPEDRGWSRKCGSPAYRPAVILSATVTLFTGARHSRPSSVANYG